MYLGGGLVRLKESLPKLSESEAKIAKYILDNPMESVNATVHQLAEKSGGSPTSIVRLWKSLGFEGYRDLQLRITSDLQLQRNVAPLESLQEDSYTSILQMCEQLSTQSIQNTLRLLNKSEIESAASVLVEAKRILLFGVSASGVVASDLTQRLLHIGLPVFFTSDYHVAAMAAATLGPEDICFVISYSGMTKDVFEVAQVARERAAKIISLTRFGDTPLSKLSPITLFISPVEFENPIAASSSRISALLVCDVLFNYIFREYSDKFSPLLEPMMKSIASHKFDEG